MAVAAERIEESAIRYRSPASLQLVGKESLWHAGVFVRELGVNDPLTHLEQYLERGETAISSIDEDLITDCAERMEKSRFINAVTFDRANNDFISRENKFSMREMTGITEDKFSRGNVTDMRQYQRAKIESKEVERLSKWFQKAQPNEAFIVESLPLTEKEKYAIVRIYQKVDEQELIERIITLHNSSVDVFNQLHAGLGGDVPESHTALELLDNMYVHKPSEDNFGDFLTKYVNNYDESLAGQNPGAEFKFGLKKSEYPTPRDDIALARSQKALRSIYLDNLRLLAKSGGWATPEVLQVNKELNLRLDLNEGQKISSGTAREMLDSSLQHIMATLNRASQSTLDELARGDKTAAVESAGHYGGEARSEGVRYEGICPSGSAGASGKEAQALSHSHRLESNSPRCVFCPNCKKTVDADKDYYDKGWWHCRDCKSTVPRHGMKQYAFGVKGDEQTIDVFSILARDFKKTGHEVNIKHLISKHAAAETELDKRRLEKQLRSEQAELQKIAA